MPGRVSSGRKLCASRRLRATILQTFPIYENIAKFPIQEDGVYDALRALTGAGLVRRIPTVRFRRWRHA